MKKVGLYTIQPAQYTARMWIAFLSYFPGLGCLYRTMYVFTIYMFFFLNCSHSSYLKIKLSANFLNPWQTLHHNVRICMGLLIHKTSLFLAFVDKFLCKNEGGVFCPFLNVEFVRHWQRRPSSVVHTKFLDCSDVELSHSIIELKKKDMGIWEKNFDMAVVIFHHQGVNPRRDI